MGSEQVKIDENLHEEVKKFVDKESKYSSYKSFYEEAVRTHLKEAKSEFDLTKEELKLLKKLADKELD